MNVIVHFRSPPVFLITQLSLLFGALLLAWMNYLQACKKLMTLNNFHKSK